MGQLMFWLEMNMVDRIAGSGLLMLFVLGGGVLIWLVHREKKKV